MRPLGQEGHAESKGAAYGRRTVAGIGPRILPVTVTGEIAVDEGAALSRFQFQGNPRNAFAMRLVSELRQEFIELPVADREFRDGLLFMHTGLESGVLNGFGQWSNLCSGSANDNPAFASMRGFGKASPSIGKIPSDEEPESFRMLIVSPFGKDLANVCAGRAERGSLNPLRSAPLAVSIVPCPSRRGGPKRMLRRGGYVRNALRPHSHQRSAVPRHHGVHRAPSSEMSKDHIPHCQGFDRTVAEIGQDQRSRRKAGAGEREDGAVVGPPRLAQGILPDRDAAEQMPLREAFEVRSFDIEDGALVDLAIGDHAFGDQFAQPSGFSGIPLPVIDHGYTLKPAARSSAVRCSMAAASPSLSLSKAHQPAE
jgi:hypothetical protein